jgi:hypothetical protein
VAEVLKQPWVAFVLPAAFFGILYAAATLNNDMALLYHVADTLFGLVVVVLVLVQAFRESLGTGLLTLCVPFYVLYFVFAVNSSGHLKALFAVSIASLVAGSCLPTP